MAGGAAPVAPTPNTLGTLVSTEFNTGADKFKETSWVAKLAISLTGMAARADIENIDPVTGLVKSGPNTGRTARQVVEGALGTLATLEANYDPTNKLVRLKQQARNPGALAAGQSVDTLVASDPANADTIRGEAKNGLVDSFLTSARNFATLDADLVALQGGGKIDAALQGEIRTQAAIKVQEKVKGIMDRFNNGEIPTLQELEEVYNAETNPEVQTLLHTRIQEIRRTQDIFNAPGAGTATDRVINNALGGLNPPMRNIYRNILTASQTQMGLEQAAVTAKINKEQLEAEANNPNNLEIFAKRISNIVRFGGPALLVGLLVAGAGAGTGALISVGAGTAVGAGAWWGLGVGGGLGILGGIVRYSESGGLKDWRGLNTLHAATQSAIAEAQAKSSKYLVGSQMKELDYLKLLTEVAARGEMNRRGLRDTSQFEKLKKLMEINAGLGDNGAGLSQALNTVLTSQFS